MRTRDSKLFKFILEFSQVLLVFFGVYSAIMCTATSLGLTYEHWLVTLIMFIASILFYFLFSVLETFRKGKLYGILGISVFFIIIGVRFAGAMKKGCVSFVNSFLKEFMNYTGTNLSLLRYADTESSSLKFCMSLVLILAGVYLIAIVSAFFYRKRRSKVFVIVTVPFVLLPLVVGKLGDFVNFFTYLIVAMTIVGTRHLRTDATDRRMRQKLAIILMTVGLVCGGICYLLVSPERYYRNMDKLEQAQNSMVSLTTWEGRDVVSWLKAYFNGDAINYGRIGNKKEITYTGETMLKVSGDVNPVYGIYMKGYVGESYEDNKWSSLASDEQYKKDLDALDDTGVTLENWHAQLRNELGDKVRTGGGMEEIWKTGTLRVRNIAFGYGNYVIPYLPTSSFVKQKNGRYTVEKPGIDYTVDYYMNYPSIMRIDTLHPKYVQGNRMADSKFWDDNKVERQNLKDFAEKYYLQTPDNLQGVIHDFNSYLKNYMEKAKQRTSASVLDRNRVSETIRAVKAYITKDTSYSLSPGKTPSDMDTVEYFLKKGKKGYCAYYATTATVLLRSQGIPARYVEGVYIPSEKLKKAVDEKNEIAVLDEDAHAWVEVYDEYYGFVPIEVTPGRGEEDGAINEPMDSIDEEQEESGEDDFQSDDSNGDDNMELATPTPVVTQKPEESMTFDDIDGNEDKPKDSAGLGDFSQMSLIWKILLDVLVILAVFALVMEVQRRVRKKIFLRNMRSLKAKRRIRMAYHHLVPILLTRGVVYRGQSMAEFTKQIADAMGLPEESIYIFVQLLYHARFGPDDIGAEELRMFGDVYHLIRNKTYEDVKFIKKLYYMYIMVL